MAYWMMSPRGFFEIDRSAFADPSDFAPTEAPDLMLGVSAAYLFVVKLAAAASLPDVVTAQIVVASVTSIAAALAVIEIVAQAINSMPHPAFVAEEKFWAVASCMQIVDQLAC